MEQVRTKQDTDTLKVVHDSELLALLEKLRIKQDIEDQKIKCKFCKEIITLDNLHSLFSESKEIKIVCDSSECIKQLMSYYSEKF